MSSIVSSGDQVHDVPIFAEQPFYPSGCPRRKRDNQPTTVFGAFREDTFVSQASKLKHELPAVHSRLLFLPQNHHGNVLGIGEVKRREEWRIAHKLGRVLQ